MARASRLALIVAGALALIILYRPGLSTQFVYDDLVTIVHNPYIHDQDPLRAMAFNPFRALVYLTYDLQYHPAHNPDTGKTNTLTFHLFNLAVHLVNGILVFLVLRRIGKGQGRVHYTAAALFLLHPLCTEAVNFISARFTLMATLFYLAAVYFYLDPARRKVSSALFWLTFVLGLACKETVATLPLCLFIMNRVLERPQRRIIAALVLVVIYIALRLNWTIVLSVHQDESLGPISYFLFQNFSVWLYALKGLFPVHLNFDHDLVYSPAPFTALLVINLAVLALLVRALLKRSAWSLAPLLFIVVLLPTSSFIPLDDPFRETRAYMPTVLTSFAIASLMALSRDTKKIPRALRIVSIIIILVFFCGLTWNRNTTWSSPSRLWRDAVTRSPMKHRPLYNYANALRRRLLLKEALTHYLRALELAPDDAKTIRNIEIVRMALESPDLDKWKEELKARSE